MSERGRSRKRVLAIFGLVVAMTHGARADEPVAMQFPVTSVTVRPGETLTDAIVVERRLYANAIARSKHFLDRASVVGKVARRSIAPGRAIAIGELREPYVFKEGSRVILYFERGGLSISCVGIALEPGVPGQHSRVRNLETGVVLNGVVKNDGRVEVGGG